MQLFVAMIRVSPWINIKHHSPCGHCLDNLYLEFVVELEKPRQENGQHNHQKVYWNGVRAALLDARLGQLFEQNERADDDGRVEDSVHVRVAQVHHDLTPGLRRQQQNQSPAVIVALMLFNLMVLSRLDRASVSTQPTLSPQKRTLLAN